jgi:hypothetical protein
MKLALKKGAQSVSVYVFIQDSSKTTGEGLTGLAYNTTGLKCYYVRPKASAAQLSLKTQTVTGAHDAGGFKEVDATNMPGIYRLDLHNNILADGVDSALVMLHGADDMAPCPLEIQLTDFDLNSNAVVTNVATLEGRLTATRAGYLDKLNVTGTLANTNNASSFMANVAALALEATAQSIKAKTDNLPASPAAVGSLMGLADGAITAAKIASNAITDAKIATDAIAGAKIKADAVTKIQNGLATPTNITKVTGAELASTQGAITWGQQKILADVEDEGALHIVNENEDGFGQYNEGGGIGQVNMGEYAGQGNVSEGETGSGQLNSGGGHGQYNVSQGIDGSGQVNIGNKSVDGYDPALALEATLSAIKGATWTNETLEAIMEAIDAIDPGGGGLSKADVRDAVGLASANLDTQLTNIKTDTGNVSTRLTATRAGYLDKLNVTGTLANTNNASSFMANVAALALEATAQSIKAKTDNLPASPAGVGAAMTLTSAYDAAKTAASQASVNAIPTTPLLAANIWTHAKRTLTMTPAEILTYITQTAITQTRGNSWNIGIEDVSLPAAKQQLAIKRNLSDKDTQALLFIDTTGDLLVINGKVLDSRSDASLTYVGGTLTLKLGPGITAQFKPGNYFYGIQGIASSGSAVEPYGGVFTIVADVVRRVT